MSIKALVSPIALAAAATLALGSASFAQTTVGDQQISDEDLPAVTEHCAMLADADAAVGAVDDAAGAEADGAEASDDAAGAEAAPDAGAAVDDAAEAGGEAGSTLDLEAITLEDCQAAGLIE